MVAIQGRLSLSIRIEGSACSWPLGRVNSQLEDAANKFSKTTRQNIFEVCKTCSGRPSVFQTFEVAETSPPQPRALPSSIPNEVTESDSEAAKAIAPFVEYLQKNAGELWARAFVRSGPCATHSIWTSLEARECVRKWCASWALT